MTKRVPTGAGLEPVQIVRVTPDGEVQGETAYYPAVLPLSGLDFELPEFEGMPFVFVFALRNKNGTKRGARYYLKGVTAKGEIVIGPGVPGTHKMEDFCLALKGPYTEEAPAETAADETTAPATK